MRISSLSTTKQYHNYNTVRKEEKKKCAEERVDYLRIKANECKYNERYRGFKGQFIKGINDHDMMAETIGQLTVIKNTNKISE